MLSDLKTAAMKAGHSEWGYSGPNDAGGYNSHPSDTDFFSEGTFDNFASNYGRFFLEWYSNQLLSHGTRILAVASGIFHLHGVTITAKISGIHWWYSSNSHAAELTAGYYNTNNNNAYLQISQMLARYNVEFDITCLEMIDNDVGCGSEPQELVMQVILSAKQARIGVSGENALPICTSNGCNQAAFDEVFKESTQYGSITKFTYLRLDSNLLEPRNWQTFTSFVAKMSSAM